MVTASLERNVYVQRFMGYKAALTDSGLPFDEQHLLIKDLKVKKVGWKQPGRYCKMAPLPDGAFITNDFSAAQYACNI